jgi:hypothetical protein
MLYEEKGSGKTEKTIGIKEEIQRHKDTGRNSERGRYERRYEHTLMMQFEHIMQNGVNVT